jgi:hypothetical protein
VSAKLDYAASYVRACQPILRLSDWSITVKESEPSDESDDIARTYISHQAKEAKVSLSETFFSSHPSAKRETICHELLHLHHWKIDRHLVPFEEIYGGPWWRIYKMDMETFVDEISKVLSTLLPIYGVPCHVGGSTPYPPGNHKDTEKSESVKKVK